MKTLLKCVFFVFAAILGVIIYVGTYNTAGYNHIVKLTSDAIKSEQYSDVAMVHGGCFDVRNLITNPHSENLDIAIFPSVSIESYSYYDGNEKEVVVDKFSNSYYIYLFNVNIRNTDTSKNKEKTNPARLTLSSANESYDYYFKVDSIVNKDEYVAKPHTEQEALLSSERNLFDYWTNYGLFNITMTSTMLDFMLNNESATSLAIYNEADAVIYSTDINLDFSQEYFTDVAPLVTKYNEYITEYKAATDKAGRKAAEEKFAAFYEGEDGFEKTFSANEYYTFRYPDSKLRPTKLIWEGIGFVALYLVGVALVYFLLFHFKFIKNLITAPRRANVNPGAPRRNAMDAKYKEVKHGYAPKATSTPRVTAPKPEVVEEVKPEVVEEVKLEVVEEATIAADDKKEE